MSMVKSDICQMSNTYVDPGTCWSIYRQRWQCFFTPSPSAPYSVQIASSNVYYPGDYRIVRIFLIKCPNKESAPPQPLPLLVPAMLYCNFRHIWWRHFSVTLLETLRSLREFTKVACSGWGNWMLCVLTRDCYHDIGSSGAMSHDIIAILDRDLSCNSGPHDGLSSTDMTS